MLRIGVLFGGRSIEREVSLSSGRTVCDHLDPQLFTVVPLFVSTANELYILPWSFLYRGKIVDFEHRLATEATKVAWDDLAQHIDFAFIALHGQYGEDGRVQAILELFHIPYLGTKLFGSTIGMNKILQNTYFKMAGIATAKAFGLRGTDVATATLSSLLQRMQEREINFPVIVKPQSEGSSLGVFVAHDEQELLPMVQKSSLVCGTDYLDIMIEEKLVGMEFNCIVITDHTGQLIALPPTEVILKDGEEIFDYHHKYMPGVANKRTPPLCSDQDLQKITDACKQAMHALHFSNVGRFDGFLTKDGRVIILDSNTITGMAPSSFFFRQAAEVGISHGQLINHLIQTELKQYHMEKITNPSQAYAAKKRVAVLFGGPSNEKETSLDSGRNVCLKLSPEKYEVIPLFVDDAMKLYRLTSQMLVCVSTKEIVSKINDSMLVSWSELKSLVDFVFIALHGGPGENGVVQGSLEMLGLPYNGPSVFTSALCMDKYKTAQYLKTHHIDVPQSMLLSKSDYEQKNFDAMRKFIASVGNKYIIKPHDDGCSVMVAAPQDEQQLFSGLAKIFEQKEVALIEERLYGMELTVGVVGNQKPRALAPSEAIAQNGVLSIEEKFLPGAGENQTPARLPAEDIALVQQAVQDAYVAVKAVGYSRIDCFFQDEQVSPTGKKRVVILEINTLPGLTPATCLFHQAAEEGLRPMQLLDEIIQLGFQAHKPTELLSVDQVLKNQQLR